jgi:septum site-determining protein MinD
MAKTVLVHSFRSGVGRSTIVANMGYLLAAAGQRVAIVETTSSSATAQTAFQLGETRHTFYDYLAGRCDIGQATYNAGEFLPGQLYVVPGGDHVARFGYGTDIDKYLEKLNHACQVIIAGHRLDVLIIDAEPGLSHDALPALTIPDIMIVVLRHDWRDYQGTGVTLDVVKKLNIPRLGLIINEVPGSFDRKTVYAELERAFQCEVLSVLPHADEIMMMANRDVFARKYPHHPFTVGLTDAVRGL